MSDSRARTRLPATPGQTVGPFFHDALPFERGNELVPPATPGALRLFGTVYDGAGHPVPDALLEIRQADSSGHVPELEGSLHRDGGVFTGWGRTATDTRGRFSFTTVQPGAHGPRCRPALRRDRLRPRPARPPLHPRLPPGGRRDRDATLAGLPSERRRTLVAAREHDGNLRWDVYLQGERETVFLMFPGHRP